MSLRGKSLKGSALLSVGEAVIYGASFVRNMILARLLTKADFGTAATFALVITLLEFTNKLGISRFVVRDKEGAQADFIATAHMMQFLAGLVSSVLIAAAAIPLANLFGLENHRWTMVVLAVIPFLNGLQHLDVRRFERDLRFGPSTLIEVIPQIVITLAAWPLAHWLGDFRAMLFLLIGKSVMSCISSHWLAEQPYRWCCHREYSIRMLKFGWPLLVTGFLMFGTLQGDQFLVATFYTMADLGPYAAAAALTMAPTFVFGRVFSSVMLPVMAKVQDQPDTFRQRYHQATAVIVTFAAVCAAGMIIGSEAFMVLVYGPKYAGAGTIMAWLAASNAYRNLRVSPALAAMAKGDSHNQMISNLWRVIALAPTLVLAIAQYPVWILACTGLLGELLACRAAWVRLSRRDGVPLSMNVISGAWVAVAIIFAFGINALGVNHWNPFLAVCIAGVCSLCVGAGMVIMMPVLRREAAALWSRWRQAGLRGLVQRA